VEKAPNFVKIFSKLEQKISEFFRRNVAKILIKLNKVKFGDILEKNMRPKTSKFAQVAKFRPIWSHWWHDPIFAQTT
jgi:hypothetical protein